MGGNRAADVSFTCSLVQAPKVLFTLLPINSLHLRGTLCNALMAHSSLVYLPYFAVPCTGTCAYNTYTSGIFCFFLASTASRERRSGIHNQTDSSPGDVSVYSFCNTRIAVSHTASRCVSPLTTTSSAHTMRLLSCLVLPQLVR